VDFVKFGKSASEDRNGRTDRSTFTFQGDDVAVGEFELLKGAFGNTLFFSADFGHVIFDLIKVPGSAAISWKSVVKFPDVFTSITFDHGEGFAIDDDLRLHAFAVYGTVFDLSIDTQGVDAGGVLRNLPSGQISQGNVTASGKKA